MNATRDYHTQSERQIPYDITYMESKIWQKWTYHQNRNRLTNLENRLVVAEGKEMECDVGLADVSYPI